MFDVQRATDARQSLRMPDAQGCHLRQGIEVAVEVQDLEVVPDGAGGDQAVDTGSDGEPGPAGDAVQRGSFLEHREPERRFDDRECQERVTCNLVRPFVSKPLKHFLHHRQADDDLLEIDDCVEAERGLASEDCNPSRRVNQNHEPLARA